MAWGMHAGETATEADGMHPNWNVFLLQCCSFESLTITSNYHQICLPNYRLQMKFAKVMFLHLSVSHSVHRGGLPQCTPPDQRQNPPPQPGPEAGTTRTRGRQPPSSGACWEMRATSGRYDPTRMHTC